MNQHLNRDRDELKSILSDVVELANNYFAQQDELAPSLLIGDLPDEKLPLDGSGAHHVLNEFAVKHAANMANSAGPNYFGFVTGGSTPAAVAGDWLVSVYDQVMSGSNDSVAHAIERQTIGFLKEL